MELDWTGAEPTRAGGAGMCAPRHLHCGTTHEPLPSFRARLAARRACPLHEQLDLEREREPLASARRGSCGCTPIPMRYFSFPLSVFDPVSSSRHLRPLYHCQMAPATTECILFTN
jgi:hypothetical protein